MVVLFVILSTMVLLGGYGCFYGIGKKLGLQMCNDTQKKAIFVYGMSISLFMCFAFCFFSLYYAFIKEMKWVNDEVVSSIISFALTGIVVEGILLLSNGFLAIMSKFADVIVTLNDKQMELCVNVLSVLGFIYFRKENATIVALGFLSIIVKRISSTLMKDFKKIIRKNSAIAVLKKHIDGCTICDFISLFVFTMFFLTATLINSVLPFMALSVVLSGGIAFVVAGAVPILSPKVMNLNIVKKVRRHIRCSKTIKRNMKNAKTRVNA